MKRGSALLIVLGMLTFIVVSAVGFAAYMRYARLPSSYLRRTSASRLLVKAALVEAIDIIDYSIGNSTWPGKSGTATKDYQRALDDDDHTPVNIYDTWMDRCYIGTNALLAVSENVDGEMKPTTVATLTTEALAYLPPGYINEARYYSRRSVGGRWNTLGFDSGRYAFFAIDVSDLFDVNRTRCYVKSLDGGQPLYGRNSSDHGRISLSYVFETPSHDDYVLDPLKWDQFVDSCAGPGMVPFVSLADLNLAMNKQNLPDELNPFCRFIRSGENFVQDNSDTDPGALLLRNLNLVTDSWYPVSNDTRRVNLANAADQPFYGYGAIDKADGAQLTLSTLVNGSANKFSRWTPLSNSPVSHDPEFAQLCDYLDANSVPISLALPTVERTPMITGVVLEGAPSIKIESQDGPAREVKKGTELYQYITTTYTVTLNGDLTVAAGTVYPFKHERGTEKSYALQAVATVALVPKCEPEKEGLLRCENAVAPAVVTCENGWKSVKTSWDDSAFKNDRFAVLQCASTMVNVPFEKDPKDETDAVAKKDVAVTFPSLSGLALASDLPAVATANSSYEQDTCTFRTVRREIKQVNPATGLPEWVPDNSFVDDTDLNDRVGLLPFEKDLSAAIAADKLNGVELIPTVQVWVRICESDKPDNTVDLVPACWRDDKNGYNLQTEAKGSAAYPMLRFAADQGMKFDLSSKPNAVVATGPSGAPAVAAPQGYVTDDPRFNYAPENFIALDNIAGSLKDEWLSRQRSGAGDRDGDIFMATSDAGYMQSAYEFCHISAISRGYGKSDLWGCLHGNVYDGNARGSFDKCPADRAMWRTYSQYNDGWASGDIDELDIDSGTRGTRVSPYAQRKEILLAALANTPLDWWAASTNKDVNAIAHTRAGADDWSFNDVNTQGGNRYRIRYGELEQMALNMKATFRNANVNEPWKRQFDTAGWWNAADAGDDGDSHSSLCGVDLQYAKLSSVDRKFLHGFWKECFAYRQQLFMVFVRAEPMMMGGGALGQTPPQLGARAMALVWRDPAATGNDTSGDGTVTGPKPHRTRILFYRQFD